MENVDIELLTDGLVADIDQHPEHLATDGDHTGRVQNARDIQKQFNDFARDNLAPFFPEIRSVGRVKTAIHYFFKLNFPMEFTSATTRAQIITLHPQNRQLFVNTLNRAKDIYNLNVSKGNKELITVDPWEVPISRTFNHRYFIRNFDKSITQPYYEAETASDPEKRFAEFINNTLRNVEWFFRNGDAGTTEFAVPYLNAQCESVPFYVDWIIKFSDGRVGLFDTKSGITAETAKTRADGLVAYIKTENAIGKNLFGGIVVARDGSWRYNHSENYQYDPSLTGWDYLS